MERSIAVIGADASTSPVRRWPVTFPARASQTPVSTAGAGECGGDQHGLGGGADVAQLYVGQTVASVTLPTNFNLHVFAIATGG